MRLITVVTMSAALLLSSTATAKNQKLASSDQPSKDATYQANDQEKKPSEKKVCKRLETSGTRMAERVCLTKEQWQKVEEEVNN